MDAQFQADVLAAYDQQVAEQLEMLRATSQSIKIPIFSMSEPYFVPSVVKRNKEAHIRRMAEAEAGRQRLKAAEEKRARKAAKLSKGG